MSHQRRLFAPLIIAYDACLVILVRIKQQILKRFTRMSIASDCRVQGNVSAVQPAVHPHDLGFANHQVLRDAIARNWSWHEAPIQDLHARLAKELPGLREAILAAPPVFLQGVRRLLAESEAANVVRLPTRRSPS